MYNKSSLALKDTKTGLAANGPKTRDEDAANGPKTRDEDQSGRRLEQSLELTLHLLLLPWLARCSRDMAMVAVFRLASSYSNWKRTPAMAYTFSVLIILDKKIKKISSLSGYCRISKRIVVAHIFKKFLTP